VNSFQKEIPKARINITLDIEKGDAKKNVELPFTMLVLGEFTQGASTQTLHEREKININTNNFNQVLNELSPRVNFTVPNCIKNDNTDIGIDLQFDSMKSFHPEHIAQQIPELKRLIAMRNLLKDLRSNITDNVSFRKEMEKIIKEEKQLTLLQSTLNGVVQEENMI